MKTTTDITGETKHELNIEALQASDPFLADMAKNMLARKGGETKATTQPTKPGLDQSNPIPVKTVEDIRAVPKGQWYKTPSGNLRQAL